MGFPQLIKHCFRKTLEDAKQELPQSFLEHVEERMTFLEEEGFSLESFETFRELPTQALSGAISRFHEVLGMAYLHKQGCLRGENPLREKGSSPLDLPAQFNDVRCPVEIKSDTDDLDRKLYRIIRDLVGPDVRFTWSWMGRKPAREALGELSPLLTEGFRNFSLPEEPNYNLTVQISTKAPAPLPLGATKKQRKKWEKDWKRYKTFRTHAPECSRLVVHCRKGPSVSVGVRLSTEGWESVVSRIEAHARHKSRNKQPFLLCYVSHALLQPSIHQDQLRLVRDNVDLPPECWGVMFLSYERTGSEELRPSCWCFTTQDCKIEGLWELLKCEKSKLEQEEDRCRPEWLKLRSRISQLSMERLDHAFGKALKLHRAGRGCRTTLHALATRISGKTIPKSPPRWVEDAGFLDECLKEDSSQ